MKHNIKSVARNSEIVWHKHPLLVSSFNILFGTFIAGVGLNTVQTYVARKKAIQEKRFAVVEGVVNYTAKAVSNLRTISVYGQGLTHKHLSGKDIQTHLEETKMQTAINDVYELEQRVGAKLTLYFTKNDVPLAFAKLKEDYHEALNIALTQVQRGESVEGTIVRYAQQMDRKTVEVLNAMEGDLPIEKLRVVDGKSD